MIFPCRQNMNTMKNRLFPYFNTVLYYNTNFCLKININCGQQVVIILVRGKCQLLNTAD